MPASAEWLQIGLTAYGVPVARKDRAADYDERCIRRPQQFSGASVPGGLIVPDGLRRQRRLIEEPSPHRFLVHHRAAAGHAPEGPVDGGGVVAYQIGELALEQGRAAPSVVMGDSRIHVMAHVGGANAVVEQVDQGAVGAIHGLQGALGPGPLVGAEVGDVGVGVLQPGVGHQPAIDHQVGQAVDTQHPGHGEVGGGQG